MQLFSKFFRAGEEIIYKRHFIVFLTASTLIHLVLLVSIPMPGMSRNQTQPELYDVDLVQPPRLRPQEPVFTPEASEKPAVVSKNTDTKKKSGQNRFFKNNDLPNHSAQAPEQEATVSLYAADKKESKYASYLQHVRYKIDSVWEYPPAAKERGVEGELTLRFSIAKNGTLVDVKLISSSGHDILDREALQTIHEASPFQPMPDKLSTSRLNILASFKYQFSPD